MLEQTEGFRCRVIVLFLSRSSNYFSINKCFITDVGCNVATTPFNINQAFRLPDTVTKTNLEPYPPSLLPRDGRRRRSCDTKRASAANGGVV